MPIKRYKPEQVVTLVRQIEVEVANGKTTPQGCKEAESRWRHSTVGEKSSAG